MARRPKTYNIPKDTTLTHKEHAVVYARVSSTSQMIEGDGLNGQEKLCQERAQNNGVKIVKVFSDGGKTGKYEGIGAREGLHSMIEFLAEENKAYTKVHFVLVDDIDRIIRDVQGWREIKAQIEQKGGARIYSLKQKIEDTPEGKLIQNVTMATKQYQREANARQVKDKQRARMLNGFRPLNPPAGYVHKKAKQGGKVLVWDTCAPVIQEGLLHFADGTLATQTDLLNFLLSKGFCTRRGNKPDLDFIADLLERERLLKYAGFIHYEPREISMVPAQHEKFFDIDVVSRILDKLQRKPYYQKCSQSEIGEKMPLRGFLYDATTSLKYGGGPSTGKNKKITYIYYSCKIPQGNGKNKTINILHDRLHTEFEQYLKQFQIDETTFVVFEHIMKDTWAKKNEVFTTLANDLQDRIKEIEDDIKKIMQLIRKSQSEKMIENYENEIINLEDEKTELLIKIGSSNKNEGIDIDELIANTKAILRNPSFIRELGDIHLQKLLLGVLFNGKIYYDKDTGFQTPEIPLVYSIKKELSEDNSVLVDLRGVEPLTSSVQTRRSSQMS